MSRKARCQHLLKKSIPEIDRQLYQKYGLSEEEIVFVESMVEPMGLNVKKAP